MTWQNLDEEVNRLMLLWVRNGMTHSDLLTFMQEMAPVEKALKFRGGTRIPKEVEQRLSEVKDWACLPPSQRFNRNASYWG